jgi:hypothetical protein
MSAHLEHRHPKQIMAVTSDRHMLLHHGSRENTRENEGTLPLTVRRQLVLGIPIFVLRLPVLLIRATLLLLVIMLLQLCHLLLDLPLRSHPYPHTVGLHP